MIEATQRYIFWDFDETILSATPIVRNGKVLQNLRIKKRDDIETLISELTNEGYKHIITTTASDVKHIENLLKRAGLGGMFDSIYTKAVVGNGIRGKEYLPVIASLGINEEQALSNILIFGDREGDIPSDYGLVLVCDRGGIFSGSEPLRRTVKILESESPTNFVHAFDKLYEDENTKQIDPRRMRKIFSANGLNYSLETFRLPDIRRGIARMLAIDDIPRELRKKPVVIE